MKIKEGFVLREAFGETMVVSVGRQTLNLKAVIRLNDTGVFLWKLLQEEKTEEQLVAAMLGEYAVDEPTAAADIHAFVDSLKEADLLE